MNPYSEEQMKDIQERIDKALVVLKELDLQPAAFVTAEEVKPNVFANKVTPYLQDLKYQPVPSPINNDTPATP